MTSLINFSSAVEKGIKRFQSNIKCLQVHAQRTLTGDDTITQPICSDRIRRFSRIYTKVKQILIYGLTVSPNVKVLFNRQWHTRSTYQFRSWQFLGIHAKLQKYMKVLIYVSINVKSSFYVWTIFYGLVCFCTLITQQSAISRGNKPEVFLRKQENNNYS